MRTLVTVLALVAAGAAGAQAQQAQQTQAASAQLPAQLVRLKDGNVGVVTADGAYLGELEGSMDGPPLAATPRRHVVVMIPVDPMAPRPVVAAQAYFRPETNPAEVKGHLGHLRNAIREDGGSVVHALGAGSRMTLPARHHRVLAAGC